MMEFRNLLKLYNEDTSNLTLLREYVIDNLSSSSLMITNVKIIMSSAEIKKHFEGIAISYYLLATIYLSNDEVERAFENIQKAEAVFDKINEKEELDNYLSIYLFYNDYYLKKGDLAKIYSSNKVAIKLMNNLNEEKRNYYKVRILANYLEILLQLGLDQEVVEVSKQMGALDSYLNDSLKIRCSFFEAISIYNLGAIDEGLKKLTESFNLNRETYVIPFSIYYIRFVKMFVEIDDFEGASLYVEYLIESTHKSSGPTYAFALSTLMRYYHGIGDSKYLEYADILLNTNEKSIFIGDIYRDLELVLRNQDVDKYLKALDLVYFDDGLKMEILKDIHLEDTKLREKDGKNYDDTYKNVLYQINTISEFHLKMAKLRDPQKIVTLVANTGADVFKDKIQLHYLDKIDLDVKLLCKFNKKNELILDYLNYPKYFRDNKCKSIYLKLIRNNDNCIVAILEIKSEKLTQFKVGKYKLLSLFVDYLDSYIKNIFEYCCNTSDFNFDFLTKLPNKTAFINNLGSLSFNNWAIAIIDLDLINQINKKYSQIVGDLVIIDLVETLKRQFGIKHVARFGGEKFIVYSSADVNDFSKEMEHCLFMISNHLISYEEYDLKYHFSCGIVELADFSDFETSVEKADNCLRWAKDNGGNQVVTYKN